MSFITLIYNHPRPISPAFHKDIPDDDRDDADEPLNPDRDATTFVSQKMLLKRERIWAQNFMTHLGD
jgi:hypothetical protein